MNASGIKYKIWEVIGKTKNKKIDLDDLTLLLLKNRGVISQKQRAEFFSPPHPAQLTLKRLAIDEKQIKVAIKRLEKAREKAEKIIIYGDYDADGICATAVLWECLYALKFDVLPYIPERFSEGYGLNAESTQKLKAKNEKLKVIITVDNGIVANGAVEAANKLKISAPGSFLPVG